MQFREVVIDGNTRFVFLLTKDEAMVFRHATRGKKAPTDEKIIHFDLATGTVWAQDGHQLVTLTSDSDYHPGRHWPKREFVVDALEFKAFVTSTKAAELLVIDTEDMSGGAIRKQEVADEDTIEPRPLGGFSDAGVYTRRTSDIQEAIAAANAVPKYAAPTFNMSTRFGHTLAAIAKATQGQEAMVVISPENNRSAVTWKIKDDVDGALWTLIAMPMLPKTPVKDHCEQITTTP